MLEFALVSPVMILMTMGLFDLSYRQYVQSVLTGAVQRAGRDASLEGGGANASALDTRVIGVVKETARNLTWESSRKAYSNYANAAPEPFTDSNSNGIRDPGECYSDINGNTQWDADPGKTGQGGANDVTIYTMTIHYPRLFPLFSAMGWSPTQTLSSTTVLKNQPFAVQNTATPATICT